LLEIRLCVKTNLQFIWLSCLISLVVVSCKKDTIRKEDFEVEGIDLSHHQNEVNWDSLSKQDLQFVFMKATEGATHIDTNFHNNWDEANRIGLRRGAYHYFSIYSTSLEQAKNFIKTVQLSNGDMPPVLDFEEPGAQDDSTIRNNLRVWLTTIEGYYKVKPIIYTNLNLYNRFIKGEFEEYPLWLARYANDVPAIQVDPCSFWQYGNRGKMPGIKGYVDFNVFMGNQGDLEQICFSTKDSVATKIDP